MHHLARRALGMLRRLPTRLVWRRGIDDVSIVLKTRPQLEQMRRAGRLSYRVLERMHEMCVPGVTTRELDEEADRVMREAGGVGLFKGYEIPNTPVPFPSHTCISINEVVVHGIADERQIVDGDIVGVDCGVRLDGWCGDSATTILVGDVDPDTRAMCETTQHILQIAIDNIKPGRRWSQVARLMQRYAEDRGYGVVREFVGHGIGRNMHEEPRGVPNYVNRDLLKKDILLRPGIVLAIEPMCTLGGKETRVLEDAWTVVTADGKPAAHYEHTIAVTDDGCEVLTDGR